MRALAIALFVVVVPAVARAQDEVPAIPIRDLPPFPDVEADVDTVSEVGVYGATLAEEETVVGAAKREQSLGTVASAVTVLTADTIRRFGYRTLAEALRSVTGVFVVDDRQIERVGVRGVQLLGDANTRILILIDGTPLNEPWSQFVDSSTALPVSLDDVARIEVIRGPVSSIYGTNAFIGIINIVTLEADKAAVAYGRTSVDTYGTVGGNAAFNSGDINRQVRGTVGYKYRAGESVTYPDLMGQSIDADGAQSVFGSIAINYGRLFAQVRAYDRTRQLPGAPYESDLGSDDNLISDRHFLGEVGYTRAVTDEVTLAARLYANRYTFRNHLAYAGMDYETRATSLWYGGEVRALVDVIEKDDRSLLSVTTGVNVELTSTESTATTSPDPLTNDFNIAGVYLEGTTEATDWLGATAGARFDRNSEFEDELSPRAALFLHQGDEYGLKLLYAHGFRNPSILEAYYDDEERFAPSLDGDGHTTLRSETIDAYEIVAYGKPFTGVKLRVSLWEWQMNDLFKRFEVPVPPTDDIRIRYQNSGILISRGAELESSYRDVAGRVAYLNAALSLTGRSCLEQYQIWENPALDTETGNCDARQNAPVFVGKLGVSSQLLLDTFHLSGEMHYISARGTQRAGAPGAGVTLEVPQYLGLNLVGYLPDVRGFDITIGARNLLGRERVPAQPDYNRREAGVEVYEVPGPGREIFARVGYRY